MERFLTILEGANQGNRKALAGTVMLVGRSRNADLQIDDPSISRRHLELQLRADSVFVENKSEHGSLLNGKPLKGLVSLHAQDLLIVGRTTLRYEESEPAGAEADEDRTRVADGSVLNALNQNAEEKKERDSEEFTRAVAQDMTMMADPEKLPGWKSAAKQKAKSSKGMLGAALTLVIVAVAAASCWVGMRKRDVSATAGMLDYTDSLYSFRIRYPLDWRKVIEKQDTVSFVLGDEKGPDWAKVRILPTRNVKNAVTGLGHGFTEYVESEKGSPTRLHLLGQRIQDVNNVRTIFFGFKTPGTEGKGIYTLNQDRRVIVQCLSSTNSYSRYDSIFSEILKTFRFLGEETQQYIDFPLPDAGMQRVALGNPAELARQVQARVDNGTRLLETSLVDPHNLFSAVQEFRAGAQLAVAGPTRAANYQAAAEGLSRATQLLERRVQGQKFEMTRALKQGDKQAARVEALKLMQVIPEKTHPEYIRAARVVKSIKPKR